jgi:MraZ protein
VFTGEYRHAIDAKGRVAVPARFRAELAGGGFVTRWIDNCVGIFPKSEWEKVTSRVADLPFSDAGSRVFTRFMFAGAFEFAPDNQGRLLVPPVLREFAGLGDEVVVVGARDHIELWAPDAWAAYSAGMTGDSLAQRIQDLGI